MFLFDDMASVVVLYQENQIVESQCGMQFQYFLCSFS